MLIILIGYILTTCACLAITYYVFKFCALEDEGGEILFLILVSFIPAANFIFLMFYVFSNLWDYLVILIEKQLKKRNKS